ncbi:MAG: enoyl-CoA hydratase/isomerase family protein [Planctomycetota bacterium]
MSESLVQYSVSNAGVATLTLSDPPANCYSYEMMQSLDVAILRARMDESVHVIVIRGDGEKFFCAGADIRLLSRYSPDYKYNFCLHANETLSRLEHTPKLTIAAIAGHCVGGGLEVALACDLRIARAGASKIGMPEVNLGVLPGTGGTQRLVRLVGKSKAIEWLATGLLMSPEEAVGHGILNAVWPAEEFWQKLARYAEGFCAPERAARAIGLMKRSVQSGAESALQEGLALERELQQRLFDSADAQEGIAAYLEKRTPRFQGR